VFDSRKIERKKSTGDVRVGKKIISVEWFGAYSTIPLVKDEKVVAFKIEKLPQPTVREMVDLGTAVK